MMYLFYVIYASKYIQFSLVYFRCNNIIRQVTYYILSKMKQKCQTSKKCFSFQSSIIFSISNPKIQLISQQDSLQNNNASQCWTKGNKFLRDNDIFNAIKCYKKSIQLQPMIQDDIIGLGCVEDRIGYHYEQQYKWIEKMIEDTQKSGSPYDVLSVCLSKYGNYEEEKKWYQKMIAYNRNYKLLFGLANLQYNNKQFQKALDLYKQSLQIRWDWDQPYQKIANIYCFKLNEDEQSVNWAKKAIALNRKNLFAVLIQALCTKEIDERIVKLQNLISHHQNYARPYNGLGNAFYNQNQYQKAIGMYKKSIQVNSKYQHPYYGLGSIHNQLLNYQQSIYWYKKCIQLNPLYDYPHYGLGIAYNNKNDIKNAIYWLQKCIQINPKYDCPYYALGNVYRSSRDYPKAIIYYQKSLECKPIDPLCFVNIALCLINSNDFQKAFNFMMKAKENMQQDKGLSAGNIQYIKQQVNKYLNDESLNVLNLKGIITFRQKIEIFKTTCAFNDKFKMLFQHG